jgi:hypothetical protein
LGLSLPGCEFFFLIHVLSLLDNRSIIESSVSWRWVFWVMMIFAGVCTAIVFCLMPETYSPIILQKKTNRLRKEDPIRKKQLYCQHEKQDWSLKGVVSHILFRPFKMLALEPILLLITIYTAIVYGLLYACGYSSFVSHEIPLNPLPFLVLQAFPIIFMIKRGFTVSQNGLIFIGVGVGTSIGSVINYLATRHYPALIKKWRGFPPPEDRLYGAMIGSPILVIGIFWLGWTGQYPSIPWYVPAMSTIPVGTGISLIFMSFLV